MIESIIETRKAYKEMSWLKFCKMYSRKYNKPFEKVTEAYKEAFPPIVMTKKRPFAERQVKERTFRV